MSFKELQRKEMLKEAIRSYITFFLLIAFVVTCNFVLFMHGKLGPQIIALSGELLLK